MTPERLAQLEQLGTTRGQGLAMIAVHVELCTAVRELMDERDEARKQAGAQAAELNQLRAHECVPTQWAYDAACAALNKHRNRADGLAAVMKEISEKARRFAMVGGPSEMQDALLTLRTVAEHAVEDDQRDRNATPAQVRP